MTGPLQDELLSAYLDGELSADERQRVEQRLAESPEDRQLVEELRQLSESLRSMPRHALGAGFREQVLRRAERAMLTQPDDRPVVLTPDWEPRRRLLPRGYRSLVWPALVVAAAVMLMVVYRDENARPPEVAKVSKAPAGAAGVADRKETTESMVRSRDVRSEPMPMAEPLSPASPAAVPSNASPAAVPSKKGVGTRALPAVAEHRGRVAAKGSPPFVAGKRADLAAEPVQTVAEAVNGVPQEGAPAVDLATKGAAGEVGSFPQRAKESQQMTVGAAADQATGAGGLVESTAGGRETATPIAGDDTRLRHRAGFDGGSLIVRVDVGPEAAKTRAFDKLLARRQITWDELERDGAASERLLDRLKTSRLKLSERPASGTPMPADRYGGPVGADVKLVRVVVTPQQIHAALVDLWSRTDLFPAVEVCSDPNESLQEWAFAYGCSRQPGTRPTDGPESSGQCQIELDVGGTTANDNGRVQVRRQPAAGLDVDEVAPDRRGNENEDLSSPGPRPPGVAAEAGARGTRFGGTAGQSDRAVAAKKDGESVRVLFVLRVVAPDHAAAAVPASEKP